jgi:pilus assembly protein CpaF
MSDGTRRLTSISEVTGMEQETITMQEIFNFHKEGLSEDGQVIGAFKATGVRPKCADQLTTAGFPLPMDMFEHQQAVGRPARDHEWGRR